MGGQQTPAIKKEDKPIPITQEKDEEFVAQVSPYPDDEWEEEEPPMFVPQRSSRLWGQTTDFMCPASAGISQAAPQAFTGNAILQELQ